VNGVLSVENHTSRHVPSIEIAKTGLSRSWDRTSRQDQAVAGDLRNEPAAGRSRTLLNDEPVRAAYPGL
jgi:hypothetical protein